MSKNDAHSQPSRLKPYTLGKKRAIIKESSETFSVHLKASYLIIFNSFSVGRFLFYEGAGHI